jgi:cell division protein FtsW
VIANLPLAWLRSLSIPLWLVAIALLACTLVPGVGIERNGSARWLSAGPILFQPLEIAKLAVVLSVAHSLASRAERVRDIRVGLITPGLIAGVPAAIVLLQPDFGGAAMLGSLAIVMAFVSGARLSHLIAGGVLLVPAAVVVLFTRDYRIDRIVAWLDPFSSPYGNSYQLVQSLLSFVSGGLTGAGIGAGDQRYYLPEAHTDFILSIAGEELGLIGVAGILIGFLGIAWCSVAVASRASEPFGMLVATGAGQLLWLQAALNAGVAMGLLPTKGTTLPFLSYGRSSLIASLIAVGLLLNVARSPGFRIEDD